MKGLTKNDLIKIYFIKPLLKAVYALCSLRGIDKKLVLFVNDRTDIVSSNFLAMAREFEKEGEWKISYLVKDTRHMSSVDKIRNMIDGVKSISRAKFVFTEDYYLPLYCINKRKKTKVCQLWHACGAFKKWGYSVLDSSGGTTPELAKKLPFHTNYDLAVTSSADIIGNYAQAYNMMSKLDNIKALGVPRTDVFFDSEYINHCKEKFRSAVCDDGRKVMLYAPTYRGTVNEPDTQFALPVDKLYEKFSDEYVLVVKLHPFMSDCVNVEDKYKDFCKILPSVYDVNELLPVTDVLITDYSSLIFEYALFDKPMVFFAYDRDKYDDFKGFYYDYGSMVPGEIAQDSDSLVNALCDISRKFDFERLSEFKDKFMSACDGHSAEKIARSMVEI